MPACVSPFNGRKTLDVNSLRRPCILHSFCCARYLHWSTRSSTRVPAGPSTSTKFRAALASARPPPFQFHFIFRPRPVWRSLSHRLHFEEIFTKNLRLVQPRNGLYSREFIHPTFIPVFARYFSSIRQKGDLERDHEVHGLSFPATSATSSGGASASDSSGGDIFQKLSAILESQNLDLGNINMFNRGGSATAGAAGDHAIPQHLREFAHPATTNRRQSSLSANSSVFYPSSHYSTSSSISTPQTPTTPSLSNILGLSTTDTGTGQSVKTFQVCILILMGFGRKYHFEVKI